MSEQAFSLSLSPSLFLSLFLPFFSFATSFFSFPLLFYLFFFSHSIHNWHAFAAEIRRTLYINISMAWTEYNTWLCRVNISRLLDLLQKTVVKNDLAELWIDSTKTLLLQYRHRFTLETSTNFPHCFWYTDKARRRVTERLSEMGASAACVTWVYVCICMYMVVVCCLVRCLLFGWARIRTVQNVCMFPNL